VKILGQLAKLFAIIGGFLMVFITLMTVASVVGRDTIGVAITGDFELSGAACGAAIGLFLPWCQYKRGNIIVDFFTAKASAVAQGWLDRMGALILAIILGILAWRTALGGLSAYRSNSGTMMLGFPEWIVYGAIVPGLALTAIIALVQALRGYQEDEPVNNPELAV
jgi:TRAP-type C4-dicarboxylate transport system permease small subunit